MGHSSVAGAAHCKVSRRSRGRQGSLPARLVEGWLVRGLLLYIAIKDNIKSAPNIIKGGRQLAWVYQALGAFRPVAAGGMRTAGAWYFPLSDGHEQSRDQTVPRTCAIHAARFQHTYYLQLSPPPACPSHLLAPAERYTALHTQLPHGGVGGHRALGPPAGRCVARQRRLGGPGAQVYRARGYRQV